MNIKNLQDSAKQFVEQNATTLLTAGGVVGTVATAVLAGRAGVKAERIMRKEREDRLDLAIQNTPDQVEYNGEVPISPPLPTRDKIFLVTPLYLPPVLTGGLTIASIIMAHRMSAQRAAALAAAYGLSQKHFEEYREKVAEKLTGPKNQAIKDDLAQDRVNRSTGYDKIVVIDGNEVLCYDQPNDRYFRGSMERINRAVNAVNAEIMTHGSAPADHFYDELELKSPPWTRNLGWNMDSMCEIEISMSETPDNRPCIAFEFANFPIEDWQKTLYN